MHLQAICAESNSMTEVVEELIRDFDRQMLLRIDVLKEEA